MNERSPIRDLYMRKIVPRNSQSGVRWCILRDDDHLLLAFGQAEIIRAHPNIQSALKIRTLADEVWGLVEGKVEFFWRDQRPDSPDRGNTFRLTCADPTLVLVPFGVAFGFRSFDRPSLLIRLATHQDDDDPEDGIQAWEAQA